MAQLIYSRRRIYVFMALLKINLSRDFYKNILLHIVSLAHARSCARSDVLRDILYSRLNYRPEPINLEQVYAIEASAERELGASRYMAVYVEPKFYEMLLAYHATRDGRLNKTIEDLLLPGHAPKSQNTITIGDNPMKCMVKVRR